jgi:hypothetical protein
MGWLIFFGIVALVVGFGWLAHQNQMKLIERAEATLVILLDELTKNSTDIAAHQKFLREVGMEPIRTNLPNPGSEIAYQTALTILEQNPSSLPARTFALAVVRWHFARSRADKKVALYDEQAMQNDILLRSHLDSANQRTGELIA